MAAGDIARVLRAPGTLVVNPTQEFDGNTSPYGGTEIGKANLCVLQPLGTSFRVESEALGEATDILEPNNQYVFSCFLRGWDDDAIEILRGDLYQEGDVTQHAFLEIPLAVPGTSAISRAVVMVYVPDDLIHVPGIVIYRGIPMWTDGAELAFQRGEELGLPLTVDCLRDHGGNMVRAGRLPDLLLS
jgi:hypothetical protein